jgi:cytoskeletal protein RodZ
MSGFGEILRAARLAKGVSLEGAEQATRIKLRYLEALENGEYNLLPAPAYARGYVRTYSTYLGLDAAEMLAQFNQECHVPEPDGVMSEVKIRGGGPPITSGPFLAVGIVVLALIVAYYLFQQYTAFVGSATVIPAASTRVAMAPTVQPTVRAIIATPTVAATPTALPIEGITVEVKIIQDCWMLVTLDGEEVYQGILKPGDTKKWSGKDKITMRAGYPSGVQVTVNGKSQGLLAPAGTGTLNITWTATQPQGVTTFIPPPTQPPVVQPTKTPVPAAPTAAPTAAQPAPTAAPAGPQPGAAQAAPAATAPPAAAPAPTQAPAAPVATP